MIVIRLCPGFEHNKNESEDKNPRAAMFPSQIFGYQDTSPISRAVNKLGRNPQMVYMSTVFLAGVTPF